jgi:branched-chain amino acid transport system permease protein
MMRSRAVLAVFLLFIASAPLLLAKFPFYVTLLNYIALATLVSLGLVLLTGVVGLMSFGQQAFIGLAAYTTAVLTTLYGTSPWIGLLAGMAITAIFGLTLGAISLRLSGHYLALSTIAWGISLYYAFGNLQILGQFTGIDNIPPIALFGLELDTGAKS